jgi:two-component system, sensor histidine kinase
MGASTDLPLAERVRVEQQDMLFRQSFFSTLSGLPFALLLAWVLARRLPNESLGVIGTWLALRFLIVGARMALRLAHARSKRRGDPVWGVRFLWLLGIDGFLWGGLLTWVVPIGLPETNSVMITALVGVVAVAIFVLQTRLVAAAAFTLPLLLPVLGRYALSATQGSVYGTYAAIGLVFFAVLMLASAHGAERRIRELLRLRFDTDRIAGERAQALALAQRHSEVKSQFLATMSHEMRTPLHGILGVARLLRADLPAGAPALQRLALIEHSGEHLLELISDLLDFSKIEAGQMVLASEALDLRALLERTVAVMTDSAGEKGLALRLDLTALDAGQSWVEGDVSRLRQVLLNLIGNAIKFTERGEVTLRARQDGERVTVEVHDSGIGIPEAEIERIFDAFHQIESTFDRRFTGTGLGLTISRELARAMHGDLVCRSRVGVGSTFTLTLHLPPASVPAPSPAQAGDASAALRGLVLLAEDNEVNALVARSVLENAGLSVEVVGDGAAALARSKTAPLPDLVLMDCQMPVMDGFEATRRIRAFEEQVGRARLPIIALTANAYEVDRERCLAAGMDDHLPKPFRDRELTAVLQRHMALHGLLTA